MSFILTEIRNNLGIITLNSEKSLNSLSLPMAEELQSTLDQWKNDDNITCVFLQGAGEKAFCAGGDIRQMYQAIIEEKELNSTNVPAKCQDFFTKEYQLDYDIHTYPKPIIVWGDGIVMGGGMGLLEGASHRIVTERSKLAMPEITIGLYPDVGAAYFLNKLPSAYGLYLGMTGTRIDGADAMYLGLADYYINSTKKEELLNLLSEASKEDNIDTKLETLLKTVSTTVPESTAKENSSFIQQFEKVSSPTEFKDTLLNLSNPSEWIKGGIKSFTSGSPSSAHIIFKHLQDNKNASLAEVFRADLNLSSQCAIHPDFAEGVRALLIDKDQSPKWQPIDFKEVTIEWINSYFKPLWSKEEHPLKHLK